MPRALQIGALSPKNADTARSWIEPPNKFETPQVVHNAMVDAHAHPLRLSEIWKAPARAGSMVAYGLKSRGVRC